MPRDHGVSELRHRSVKPHSWPFSGVHVAVGSQGSVGAHGMETRLPEWMRAITSSRSNVWCWNLEGT